MSRALKILPACALLLRIPCVCAAEAVPDPNRGLYAIWTKAGDADTLPFIKGGQVVLQWQEVEPAAGQYDFRVLQAKLEEIAKLGRATSVQLNANRHPEFLFQQVPQIRKTLNKAQQDRQGTLQYWHPAYIRAYTALVARFAREVKASPLRSHIVGVRLNYDALGTEGMVVRPDDQDPGEWIAPPGVTPAPRWTEQIAAEYRRTVLDTFVRNFHPEIRIFLRDSIFPYPHPDQAALDRLKGPGNFGLFTTGSEIEPRSPSMLERYTDVYAANCRTARAVCYAESLADATGRHTGFQDPRWCSPEQWNYWRLLSDLNSGFSMIAVYGSDLTHADNPEYRAAFDFAARYAGCHASPSVSPGAWVALREGSVLLKGDYTFLMRRLSGDEMKGEEKIGPDSQRFGTWARTLPSGKQAKFALDPAFAGSLKGAKPTLRVIYLDRGHGTFTVRAAAWTFQEELQDSGRWKTGEFQMDAARLAADPTGAHIVIEAGADLTLHMIEVVR